MRDLRIFTGLLATWVLVELSTVWAPSGIAQTPAPSTTKAATTPESPSSSTFPVEETDKQDEICAMVNGVPIYRSEVLLHCHPYLNCADALPEVAKESFARELERLIERELLLQDAAVRLKSKPQTLAEYRKSVREAVDRKIDLLKRQLKMKTDEELTAFLRIPSLEVFRCQVERTGVALEYLHNRIAQRLQKTTNRNDLPRQGAEVERESNSILRALRRKATIEYTDERR